jgi:hypothetical protein
MKMYLCIYVYIYIYIYAYMYTYIHIGKTLTANTLADISGAVVITVRGLDLSGGNKVFVYEFKDVYISVEIRL